MRVKFFRSGQTYSSQTSGAAGLCGLHALWTPHRPAELYARKWRLNIFNCSVFCNYFNQNFLSFNAWVFIGGLAQPVFSVHISLCAECMMIPFKINHLLVFKSCRALRNQDIEAALQVIKTVKRITRRNKMHLEYFCADGLPSCLFSSGCRNSSIHHARFSLWSIHFELGQQICSFAFLLSSLFNFYDIQNSLEWLSLCDSHIKHQWSNLNTDNDGQCLITFWHIVFWKNTKRKTDLGY